MQVWSRTGGFRDGTATEERLLGPSMGHTPLLAEERVIGIGGEDAEKAAGAACSSQAHTEPLQSSRRRFRAWSPFVARSLGGVLLIGTVWVALYSTKGEVERTSSSKPIWMQSKAHEAFCSVEDHTYLATFHEHAQNFYTAANHCGKQALDVGWTLSWNWNKFEACFREANPPLSDTCVGCFNAQGEYGFENCKWPCLVSWCSEACLTCNDKFKDTFLPCVGMSEETRPIAMQC
jgi:hypothetical protein